jgi:hypothetical protein
VEIYNNINLKILYYDYPHMSSCPVYASTDIIKLFIHMNGIFDIVLGTGILFNMPALRCIHLSLFKQYDSKHRRLIAYWILNYGIIRLFSFYCDYRLLQVSYILEALAYLIEMQKGSICIYRGYYTISICLFIAGIL